MCFHFYYIEVWKGPKRHLSPDWMAVRKWRGTTRHLFTWQKVPFHKRHLFTKGTFSRRASFHLVKLKAQQWLHILEPWSKDLGLCQMKMWYRLCALLLDHSDPSYFLKLDRLLQISQPAFMGIQNSHWGFFCSLALVYFIIFFLVIMLCVSI